MTVQPPDLPTGWVRLGARRWLTPGLAAPLLVCVLLYNVSWQVVRIVTGDWPVVVSLLLSGVAVLVIVGSAVVLQRVRVGNALVNFDTGELRRGRRTVAIDSLDSARVAVGGTLKSPQLALVLSAESDFQVVAAVRLNGKQILSGSDSAQLLEVLRRSSIVMPEDKYDPTGKFAKANFPAHLTKDEAIDFVLDPPAGLSWREPGDASKKSATS